jgi:dipeptidyl aminopeptidase/acylaminoacyl peptidase
LTITAAVIAMTLTSFIAVPAIVCQLTLHVPRTAPAIPANLQLRYPAALWQVRSIRAFDGVRLDSWFLRPAVRNGNCVMVLHGIGDSRHGSAGDAPQFIDQGYSVLLPDSRAHGSSEGELVTYGLLEKSDVLSWAHWLRQQDCTALYALGESLGGSVLIQAAALGTDFRAIVAESPFADLPAIAEFRLRQILHLPRLLQSLIPPPLVQDSMTYAKFRYGIDLHQVQPIESIRRATTPILLIHGLQDSRTPYWHSQALARANASSVLWLVPDAEHTAAYSTAPLEFRRRVLGWFAEH